jgi:hypothetical protein
MAERTQAGLDAKPQQQKATMDHGHGLDVKRSGVAAKLNAYN